jgi:hypothetical protein
VKAYFAAVVLIDGSIVYCSGPHWWKNNLLQWFSLVEVQFAAVVLTGRSTVLSQRFLGVKAHFAAVVLIDESAVCYSGFHYQSTVQLRQWFLLAEVSLLQWFYLAEELMESTVNLMQLFSLMEGRGRVSLVLCSGSIG